MPTYYYLNRPPGIGCQPDGFDPDTRETYVPRRIIAAIGRPAWGKVDYLQPLTPDQCYRYELLPADPVERAAFWLSREDPDVVDDYIAQPDDVLEQLRDQYRDRLAAHTLTLRQAGVCP